MCGNKPPGRSPSPARSRPFVRGLVGAVAALLIPSQGVRANALPAVSHLIPPLPQSVADIVCSDPILPPPHLLPDGIRFTAPFGPLVDRVYWDIPLPKIPSGTTTLLLDLTCTAPEAVRAVSIHLHAGAGWYSAETAPPNSTNRQTLALPRASFSTEGTPAAWQRARRLRLSLWKRADQPVTVTLHAVAARRDVVAIVRGGAATAPGEADFARQMADRAAALLTKAGIPFTLIDDTFDEGLGSLRLLLLPWSPTPDPQRLRLLERFVRSNGKLIVFYNASAPLAASLGMAIDPWRGVSAGHAWTSWTNAPAAVAALPLVVPHRTTNLLSPRPAADNPFDARTIAVWADSSGRATDLPACLVSTRGAWFAHVPPLASASAADFMRHVVTRLLPDLGAACATEMAQAVAPAPHPDPAVQQQAVVRIRQALAAKDFDRVAQLVADRRAARAAATLAAAPRPAANEIRAVWENGTGRRPSQLQPLFADLARQQINTVYYHMQSGGSIHLKTAETLPLSRRGADLLTPRLTEALAAATQHGIGLHAWVTCWSLDDIDKTLRDAFAADGRLMRDAQGNDLPWLCPSHPANQTLVLAGIAAWARNGVPGIHLDYIRYPEQGCYAPATRNAFERFHGREVGNWPRAVQPDGDLATVFQKFRCQEIAQFVKTIATTARDINPEMIISAAVFPDPATARTLGQEWATWLREKSVDYICPMTYTENSATFSAWIDACLRAAPDSADRLVAALGTGADESQLDLLGAAEQIATARARHLKGFAFFAVDSELLGRILPALNLGP